MACKLIRKQEGQSRPDMVHLLFKTIYGSVCTVTQGSMNTTAFGAEYDEGSRQLETGQSRPTFRGKQIRAHLRLEISVYV